MKVLHLAMRMLFVLVVSAALHWPTSRGRPATSVWAQDVEESPIKAAMQKQFKEGKKITFGVFQTDVDPAQVPDAPARERLVAEASSSLNNIDQAERSRRRLVGVGAAAASTAIYSAMLYFNVGFIGRLVGLYLPVSISAGFLKSAQEGL
jgi:hypothetical protein